ncbi:MAG: hypothetical protein H0V89_12000 [Deltaproteobacteria bacterium]|nr:hypothetical protein [Deltaproteobacteria bacterium]
MVLLTVRSGRDGRLLARIVEKDGHSFVLDVGERRVIDDATQRLLKGFTMFRMGGLVSATPQSPELLSLLAEFYASEGGLVAFDEPDWIGRTHEEHLATLGSAAAREVGYEDLSDDHTDYAPVPVTPAPRRGAAGPVSLAPFSVPDDFEPDPPTELGGPIQRPLPPRPSPLPGEDG